MPLVIGPPQDAKPGDTAVVAMLFKRDLWKPEDATKYLKDNNFKNTKVVTPPDDEDQFLISEQLSSLQFLPGTIRTISVNPDQFINASIGKLRTR